MELDSMLEKHIVNGRYIHPTNWFMIVVVWGSISLFVFGMIELCMWMAVVGLHIPPVSTPIAVWTSIPIIPSIP
jgi:hypothetical protein